jgi:TolB-like protein/Tfp pilus assembly protein PilF
MPSLLQRLKERKLFQWALAYLAGAWLVFQGIEVLAEPWNLSEAVQRTIHVLLGIGFIVTLVLAWYHGEKGRQKASGIELLILAGILVIAGAAVALLGRGDDSGGEPDAEQAGAASSVINPKSVAVLPFANLSADPDNEYFSDGITSDIINRLAKVADLQVIARTSVMQYKATQKPIRQIGRELRVATIVEGEVQRLGGRVRINAQLIDADTDLHLWADTYDRELTAEDIFEMQSEIAQQIAEALQAEFSPSERARVEKGLSTDLEAYNLYLRGLYFWGKFTEQGIRASIDYYRQAIEADPGFAEAYVGLTMSNIVLGLGHGAGAVRSRDAWAEAGAAIGRALELDDELGEAHAVLGFLLFVSEFEWERAEQEFKMAIELSPVAQNHNRYGLLLTSLGRFDEAIAQHRHAQELDPLAPIIAVDLAWAYLYAGRYAAAETEARKALELDPDFPVAHEVLGSSYIRRGRVEDGLAELEKATEVAPQGPAYLSSLGWAYATTGRRVEAEEVLTGLLALADSRYVSPYDISLVYAGLDPDSALAWLDRAIEERSGWVSRANVHFAFDSLRSDPRFVELLGKMRLSP